MVPAKLVKGSIEVDARLHHLFGVTRDDLIRVAQAAVIARNDCTGLDPVNARGLMMYIAGTRETRRVLLSKGWAIDRTDNIESTYNEARAIKIIYQNTDTAADENREPQAISGKGPAAARLIDDSQGFIFPEWEAAERKRRTAEKRAVSASAWFLCLAFRGEDVLLEISCPRPVEGDQFNGFHERIFLVRPGEWGNVDLSGSDTGSQDIEVIVTRK